MKSALEPLESTMRRFRSIRISPYVDGVFMLFLVGVLAVGTFEDPRQPNSLLRNLDPLPDAAEYVIVASNITTGNGPFLYLNGVAHPSRYPLGYPLLLIPFSYLAGDLFLGAFITNFLSAAFLVILFYKLLLLMEFRRGFAFIACLLVVTNPLILLLTKHPMSEIPTLLLAMIVFISLVKIHKEASPNWYVVMGLALGYSCFTRYANIALIPPLFIFLLVGTKHRVQLRNWIRLTIPLIIFAVLIAVQNRLLYGAFSKTGYSLYGKVDFDIDKLWSNVGRYILSLFLGGEGHSLWLTGPFISIVVTISLWLGIFVLLKRKEFGIPLLGGGFFLSFLSIFAFWSFFDDRFFLNLFPFLFAGAAFGLQWISRKIRSSWNVALIIVVLFAHSTQPLAGDMNTLEHLTSKTPKEYIPANLMNVQHVNTLLESFGAGNDRSAVLTPLNLFYHDYFSNKRYMIFPLGPDQEYTWYLGFSSVIDTCQSLLKNNWNVYVEDFVPTNGFSRPSFELLRKEFNFTLVDQYIYGSARFYQIHSK